MNRLPKEGYHGPGWYRYRIKAYLTDGELLVTGELSKLYTHQEVAAEKKRIESKYKENSKVKTFQVTYYYEGEKYPGGWT